MAPLHTVKTPHDNLDCVFVGNSSIDILMLVSALPKSDQRIAATRMAVSGGGLAGTPAVALASLGGRTGLITAIGRDEMGKMISRGLEEQKFDCLKIYEVAGKASSTGLVQVEPDGKRCITVYGGCIGGLHIEDMDKEPFHNTKYVHIGVPYPEEKLTLDTLKYVKENTGALTSVDSGNFSRELCDRILPWSDIFIPDDKTVRNTLGLEPKEACKYYIEHGAKIACVTLGPRGAVAYDGKSFYEQEAYPVDVLDTTGAGDNFHGAFLYGLVQGWKLPEILRFACVFSSLTCRGLGGREAIPTLSEVMDILKSQFQ